MKEILYDIDGQLLNINEVSKKYGISVSTLYRRLGAGVPIEEAISYPRKDRDTRAQYSVEDFYEYPDNLICDLTKDIKDLKIDFDYVKPHFDENINILFKENSALLDENDAYIIMHFYKHKESFNRIARELKMSKVKVVKSKERIIDTLKKPYFADYYLLGYEFVQKRESYFRYREAELIQELGLEKINSRKSNVLTGSMDELTLVIDKNLKVEVSITRLHLNLALERRLVENGITTINQLLELKRRELLSMSGIGMKSYEEIQRKVGRFIKGLEIHE